MDELAGGDAPGDAGEITLARIAAEDRAGKRELKRRSPRRERRRAERLGRPIMPLGMTPMIDVVFQLLVYFLVATNFAGREEVFRVDLPAREREAAPEAGEPSEIAEEDEDPFTLDLEPVRILVTTTGPGAADYRLEIVGPLPDPDSFEQLRAELARHRADPADASGGLFLPTHPVVLEPSPATSWQHSVEAFNAAVRAGYTNVIFRALP